LRVAFVTNICAHYRVKTFETLAHYQAVDFFFFSAGDEWYWQQQHGVRAGEFQYKYLPGFRVGQTRVTPTLPWELWRRNYDVYIKCINGRFALPVTYLVARLRRKPFILWTGIWMRLQTRAHRLFFPLTRYIYQHADAVVVYGEHVKRYLMGEGVAAERIFVAAHAVDNDDYNRSVSADEKAALLQQLNIAPQQKVVLYLGRLEETKGLPYLLDAFASLRRQEAVLVLAGAGTERARLEQMTHELGIAEQVRFVGYVAPSEAILYYAAAWIYVLPSVTMLSGKEPWGLVTNEAFNQGLPVIVTDAVGAAAGGLVHDGVNGQVVPERDSFALAQALRRVLDNPEWRDQQARSARQVIARWDNEQMVQGFRQAIEFARGKGR
jgi:glycosyltransferase involved in cell wall biosynthesis